ncbi:MAG: reverse transcriptase-like protein [Patescibacteria group bacterium]|nr:reverse transcriptase-like protein [Patescibacteria group bacterium]
MWQETEQGLYKQFNFKDFNESFAFMTRVAQLAHQHHHYPRWENEWSVVQIWLATRSDSLAISDRDRQLAAAIDNLVEAQTDTPLPAAIPRQDKVKVYADGGSRGNPGPSASGFVILDMDDTVLMEQGVYLGITTNNQAEYTALKLALEACKKMDAHEVFVHMDSLLVVNQMKGVFKIRNRELWPIHQAIKELAKSFQHIDYVHVPRELNKLADAAVNRAMDKELGITHPKAQLVN